MSEISLTRLTNEQALEEQKALFNTAIELLKKKRADYSGGSDPFKNFRQSTALSVEPWRGAAVRFMDKVTRVFQLFNTKDGKGQVVDETIEDTLFDILNYAVIMYQLWREEQSTQS